MTFIGSPLFRTEKRARTEQKRFRQRQTVSVSAPNSSSMERALYHYAGVLRSQSLARERSPPAINNIRLIWAGSEGKAFTRRTRPYAQPERLQLAGRAGSRVLSAGLIAPHVGALPRQ